MFNPIRPLAAALVFIAAAAAPSTLLAGTYGDFTYTDHGAYIELTAYNGAGGAVVMPDTIEGKPVTGFGTIFKENAVITSVDISDNATSIADQAFFSCGALSIVNIGASVTNIYGYAFAGCSSLSSVTIPVSVTTIGTQAFLTMASFTATFEGNAPAVGFPFPFGDQALGNIYLYYHPGATGFTTPWWEGYECYPLRQLTVNYGSGGGLYGPGATVSIEADPPMIGKVFNCWTGDTATIADIYAASTTLAMPDADTAVTATYRKPRISGTVSGEVKEGVLLTLSGMVFPEPTTTTDADGNYSFSNLDLGNYTITPSLANHSFTPASRGVSVFGDSTGNDFTSAYTGPARALFSFEDGVLPAGWSTSGDGAWSVTTATAYLGTHSAQAGAIADGQTSTLTYTGDFEAGSIQFHYRTSCAASSDLEFSIDGVPQDSWSGESAWTASKAFQVAAGPRTLAWTYSQSGSAGSDTAWLDAVKLPLAASNPRHTLTVNSGTGGGDHFPGATVAIEADPAPLWRVFNQWTGDTANVADVNAASTSLTMPDADTAVTATYRRPRISGTVSGAVKRNVLITLHSDMIAPDPTTTTDADGNYSFTDMYEGEYTLTPSRPGCGFTPASRSVTIADADSTGNDFSAVFDPNTIAGTVSGDVVEGVTITLSGAASKSTTTDAYGNYAFTYLVPHLEYTVTPSLAGYSFTPASRRITLDVFAIADFTAAPGVIYVKWDAAGANNGGSWADACTDLQAGINAAALGGRVLVAAGTYKPSGWPNGGSAERERHFSLKNRVAVYGGFNGTETSLGQRSIAANPVILSGDIGTIGDSSDNCYHVFFHPASAALDRTAVLDGFAITGGNADGVHCASCSPSIANCAFAVNGAVNGAGIGVSSCSPSIVNGVFSGNTASGLGGGAVSDDSSAPMVFNCVLWGNSPAAQIYDSGSTPVVSRCLIQNGYGGGSGIITDDPLFADPANPPGPDGFWLTDDDGIRLTRQSPAVNAGARLFRDSDGTIFYEDPAAAGSYKKLSDGSAYIPASTSGQLNPDDCRGHDRPEGAALTDLGGYEYGFKWRVTSAPSGGLGDYALVPGGENGKVKYQMNDGSRLWTIFWRGGQWVIARDGSDWSYAVSAGEFPPATGWTGDYATPARGFRGWSSTVQH